MALNSNVGRNGNAWIVGENIFDECSDSNVSDLVTVDDDPIVIKAFNLEQDDIILVEMVAGEGAGRYFAPFCPPYAKGQENLKSTKNVLPIALNGRYRFILQRANPAEMPAIGQVIVIWHKVAMTHEWVSAYLKCPSSAN